MTMESLSNNYSQNSYSVKINSNHNNHNSNNMINKIKDEFKPSLRITESSVTIHECEQCGHGFKKKCDLIRHVRIHTGEKPFTCGICWKNFRVQSTCDAHVKTHGGRQSVICSICGNSFVNKNSLRVHMRLHTGSKPYACPHCDKCFRTSGHRKSHMTASHNSNPTMKARRMEIIRTTTIEMDSKLNLEMSVPGTGTAKIEVEDIKTESFAQASD